MHTQLSRFFITFQRITKTLIGIGILGAALISLEASAAVTPPLTGSDSESILPANFPKTVRTQRDLVYTGYNSQYPIDTVRCAANSVGTGANQDTFGEQFTYTHGYDTNDPWYTWLDGEQSDRNYVQHRDITGIRCSNLSNSLAYRNAP